MPGLNRYSACFAVLYVASLLVTGYNVYFDNQALQLPLVQVLRDPSLYANDPLVQSLRYYPSLLWPMVAIYSQFAPLEPLLLGLFLFGRFLTLYAAARLADAMAPGSKLAVIGAAAMFALAPTPIVGNGTLVTSYVEQTSIAIPFLLLAVAAFYRRMPMLSAGWLALGCYINILYASYALIYIGTVFLADTSYRRNWRPWLKAAVWSAGLASPALLVASAAYGQEPADLRVWLHAILLRSSHHLLPLQWSPGAFLRFGALAVAAMFVLYKYRLSSPALARLFAHSGIWTAVSLSWIALAFIAAYVLPYPSLLVLQPARGADLWYCFIGVALIAACAQQVEDSSRKRTAYAVVSYVAAIFVWRPPPAWVVLLPLIAFAGEPFRSVGRRWVSASSVVVVVTLSVFAMGVYTMRVSRGPAAVAVAAQAAEIDEIARWARRATPPDAVFLVNPLWEQFRPLSMRPVFVTWKDGTAIFFDRSFVDEWITRMAALGFDVSRSTSRSAEVYRELQRKYDSVDSATVAGLASTHSVRYWVLPEHRPTRFPTVFTGHSYRVVAVDAGDDYRTDTCDGRRERRIGANGRRQHSTATPDCANTSGALRE